MDRRLDLNVMIKDILNRLLTRSIVNRGIDTSRSPFLFLKLSYWFTLPFTNLDLKLVLCLLHHAFDVSSTLLGTCFHKRESLNRFQWDPIVPCATGLLQGLFLFHCFSHLASFRWCNLFRCTALNQWVGFVLTKLEA